MTDVYVVIKDGEPVYATLNEMNAEDYVHRCIFEAEDEASEELGYDEDDWAEQHMADVAFQAGFDASVDYDVMEVPDVFVTGIKNPEDPDEEAWMSQSCDITHGSNVTIADLCQECFLSNDDDEDASEDYGSEDYGYDDDEPDDTDDPEYYERHDHDDNSDDYADYDYDDYDDNPDDYDDGYSEYDDAPDDYGYDE